MSIFNEQPVTKRAKIGKVDIAITHSKNTVLLEVSQSQATGRMDGPLPDYATQTIELNMSPSEARELGDALREAAEAANV